MSPTNVNVPRATKLTECDRELDATRFSCEPSFLIPLFVLADLLHLSIRRDTLAFLWCGVHNTPTP